MRASEVGSTVARAGAVCAGLDAHSGAESLVGGDGKPETETGHAVGFCEAIGAGAGRVLAWFAPIRVFRNGSGRAGRGNLRM